jgi:hypothetical protein
MLKMALAKNEKSNSAHWKSTIIAGVMEVCIFHPVDTIQKRLMNNPNPIYDFNKSIKVNFKDAFSTVFLDSKTQRFSLYPGFAWAGTYKILQRGWKFGGQPFVERSLQENIFGNANKFWAAGLSGAIMGAGEVIFLPLDIMKIRRQTGSSDSDISYRALHVTVMRNIIGSFILFSVPQLVQTMIAKDEKLSRAEKTLTQAIGAVACLLASNPFDVVKTRMQANPNSEGAYAIASNMIRNNPTQLFKSIAPKVFSQGIKLTFFMAAKDKIEEMVQNHSLNKKENEPQLDRPGCK